MIHGAMKQVLTYCHTASPGLHWIGWLWFLTFSYKSASKGFASLSAPIFALDPDGVKPPITLNQGEPGY